MNARFLVVLRIDDRIASQKGHIADSPAGFVGDAPAGLELYRFTIDGVEMSGIADWESAIAFWQNYVPRQKIDLVAADVRFNFDRTSPIVTGGATNNIPTGLSHVKPFVAVARMRGLPTGIGLHTGDPGFWQRLAAGDDRATVAMGLLAAHESGEVAAILGQAAELHSLSDEARIQWCWRWLANRTVTTFGDACRVAVRDYRRELVRSAALGETLPPRVMMLPESWVRLAQWCERMNKKPEPFGPTGPAVEFVLRDGGRDAIWLRSLFGDVSSIDLEKGTLPSVSFDYHLGDNLSEEAGGGDELIDSAGMPRVGSFVRSMRGIYQAVEAAWKAVCLFPVELEDSEVNSKLSYNLKSVLPDDSSGKLARGLAVLFQILRRDKENWDRWEYALERNVWDAREQRFLEENSEGNSLRARLLQLLAIMPNREEFDLADPFEQTEWADQAISHPVPRWVQWHVDLLVEAGALKANPVNATYKKLKSTLKKSPPLPVILPSADFFVGKDAKKFLLQTLGFSSDYGPGTSNNWHGVPRAIQEAFGLDGDDFISDFIKGGSPAWVKEICGEVLLDKMEWDDPDTWPLSIKR